MKVLVEKSFRFVDILWVSHVLHNKSDLRCVVAQYYFFHIITPLMEEDEEDDEDELIRDGTLG